MTTSQNYRQILLAFHKTSKDKGWYQSWFSLFFLSFHFKFQDLTRIVKKEFEKRDNTPNFMFRAQLALGSGASTFNVYYQNSTNHEVGGERLKNQRIKLLFSKLFKFVLNFYKKFCSYIDNHYLKLPFLIGNIFFPLQESRHHSSLHDISGRMQCLYHWRLREITVLCLA